MGIKQNMLRFVVLFSGMYFMSFSASVLAEPLTGHNQFNYDVKSGVIDETELNQFVDAQNAHPVTFFEADENSSVVMSDIPIKHVYMASSLSDLGYSMVGDQALIDKSSSFTLADSSLQQMPVVPDFVAPTIASPQPAKVEQVQAKVDVQPVVHRAAPTQTSMQPPQPITTEVLAWLAAGLAIYTLILMIIPPASQVKSRKAFEGKIGAANDMVGQGGVFEFTNYHTNRVLFPANRSHLNLMWMTKHFKDRKQGEMDSYFYMTFYVPPQHGYAASMETTQKVHQPQQPEIQV